MRFVTTDYAVYTANELNQYTRIDTNGTDFTPEYDADGNQTRLQSDTGTWEVSYNAQNRAVSYENKMNNTRVECVYDYMGRRVEKKVSHGEKITRHERYVYRDYLQIAALDLLAEDQPLKHTILWDPTQPTATRPLAIQQSGTWYTYGWDLTKNICELYTAEGQLTTTYTYTPFGKVTADGDVDQAIQWSSEVHDPDLALVYYNYRYYNPTDGRWTRRDPIGIEGGMNLYGYIGNSAEVDYLGFAALKSRVLAFFSFVDENGNVVAYFPYVKIYSDIGLTLSHSQFFFDDGSDIGLFSDGKLRSDDEKALFHTYITIRDNLDDKILRKAIKDTPPGTYLFLGSIVEKVNNCNSWAKKVLERYDELINKCKKQ